MVESMYAADTFSRSELFRGIVQSLLIDHCGITIGTSHLVAEKHFSIILTNAVESCLLYGLRVFQDPGSKTCFSSYPFLVIHLCPLTKLYETSLKPHMVIHNLKSRNQIPDSEPILNLKDQLLRHLVFQLPFVANFFPEMWGTERINNIPKSLFGQTRIFQKSTKVFLREFAVKTLD